MAKPHTINRNFIRFTTYSCKTESRLNFANERVKAHNNWPTKTLFKGEIKFEQRLKDTGYSPFTPISIQPNTDPEFQRCVGHLLDALEEIPRRPDFAFDHFYRIIDITGSHFHTGGNKGICQNMPETLLKLDSPNWKSIIDTICLAMPLRTYELLAKRLLTASIEKTPLHKRAEHAFGARFHNAFVRKYSLDSKGQPLMTAPDVNRHSAAKLLKLYMSGTVGMRAKAASDPALDFTNTRNVADHRRRSEVLMSLLLFTVRNERTHGAIISPFRTSKVTMDRYESYYFIMLISYIYALGLLSARFSCTTPEKILIGARENIKLHQDFFK